MVTELTSRQSRIVSCIAETTLGSRRPSFGVLAKYIADETGIARANVDRELPRLVKRTILCNLNPGKGKTGRYSINLDGGAWLPPKPTSLPGEV